MANHFTSFLNFLIQITATTTLANANVLYGDASCKSDYLLIAGGSETGSTADLIHSKDRFCGIALGYCKSTDGTNCGPQIGAVTTYTKPFIIGVITDDSETGDSANYGFNLLYSQQPCLTAG